VGQSKRSFFNTSGVHVTRGMSSGLVVFKHRPQGQFSAPWKRFAETPDCPTSPNMANASWLFVIFGEQGVGLLPATLGLGSKWTRWRLLRHLRPLYPAPAAWRLSQFALRITKSDDDPASFTLVGS
jgi:hypothetical protein